MTVVVIAGSVSGIGAVVAAGASQTSTVTPPTVTTTSTTATQATAEGVTHTISVAVRGGSLSVRPASVVVPLTWDAACGCSRGQANVDVIDARGTLTGWTARAVVNAGNGTVSVRPAKPVVVDGEDSGLAAGKKVKTQSGGIVTLGSAAAGGGGGSYRIPVEVEVTGHRATNPVTVTLVPQVTGA
ncbi:MAG TPA: hypothetical protein VG076_00175 [Acidimicrobiales bacterium]|nr:hypothetical protein [Acidimicrobiales bacterium]